MKAGLQKQLTKIHHLAGAQARGVSSIFYIIYMVIHFFGPGSALFYLVHTDPVRNNAHYYLMEFINHNTK